MSILALLPLPIAGAITLLNLIQIAPDTVVAVTEPRGWAFWLEVLTNVATILIALAVLAVALVAVVIALQVRKLLRKFDPLIARVNGHLDPIFKHAHDVGENISYVSSSVRRDVERVSELVEDSQQRLGRATAAMEQRVREFNALLGVVQEEAEDLFIDTAATVRGMQVGSDTYRRMREESHRGRRSNELEPPPS